MLLTKFCKGCRCASCRWQGTDNCAKDTDPPCSRCHGSGRVIDPYGNWACYRYIDASFQCDAFMEKGKHHENEKT